MNRINTWLSHGRITQWSMYVILSVAEGNEKKTTTFLDVPPNRFGCRGDDNERTNERERTLTPPPPTLCATGKGGGRSGATGRSSFAMPLAFRSKRGEEPKADSWDFMVVISQVALGDSNGYGRLFD